MEKNYRIHTNIASDTVLNVNMKQDFDFMEILSLKLRQKDAYRLHSSNYGVIIGRVLANDAFGISNAKISLFIERDENDSTLIESIYPYSDVMSKDREGRRYNILPDYSDNDCYRVVGTFPNKRLVLDDSIQLEIYDKYWKYTTVTNNAGDYMIFGVPSGSQKLHVDIDLSDIGILSQTPTDFTYKGYNLEMFDSPKQFKESTNLDNLAQIISQNKSVFVYPFWGDVDNGVAAITRSDIQVQYKFEPTCVFMGSIVSDNGSNSIGHKCAPSVNNGMNDQLVASEGTIEMIRKTVDGFIEEYQIKGNRLINNDGVWCYQIPMNLDYIGTDEYGNIVPTDNPNKGIATRTQVRFRISKDETGDEAISRHTAKYLVPMNPMFDETKVVPTINISGKEVERMYTFGTSTPQSCFRDLYWNNVYSIKNYIPKTQVAHRAYSKNYSALKGANLAADQNQIPFNKLNIDLPFTYMVICLVFIIVTYVIYFINEFIIRPINKILNIFREFRRLIGKLPLVGKGLKKVIPDIKLIGCINIQGGIDGGNVAYYPGCGCPGSIDCRHTDCPTDMGNNCTKSSNNEELIDKIQQKLAQDFKVVKLDLYQDWVNGCLYMPLWYWRKRKKKSWLFGLIKSRAKNEYCSCDKKYGKLKTYVTCDVNYKNNSLEINESDIPDKEERWHKFKKSRVRYFNGLIKPVENKDGLTAYYYVALQPTADVTNQDLAMLERINPFPAIRLYATDIILLGNLRENNLYGIPQFFKSLPSTTANVPPIATIEEESITKGDDEDSNVDTGGGEDSGTTITTGMDWGHDGNKQVPVYRTGLFMDLACTYAKTRPKSCFNVERLSEYGVNLDMSYDMSYVNSSTAKQPEVAPFETDGFINKLELDDMENRAMFATMNHIGFIPQDYQDSVSGYTTQVLDDNTNYLIPKFKFIYPVDFDGRLQIPMKKYKKSFRQALFDERDEQYLTFRLGAESGNKNDNPEGRIRHFYIHKDDNDHHMPLYNNSFYFYFGIKPGSTAIDKFNEMFNAVCFKNVKMPFTPIIETQGKSYCPIEYDANTTTTVCDYSQNYAYGYIRVMVDDIKAPYTYALYDSNNIEIIRESGMTMTDFVIGGTFIEDGGKKCVKVNENGNVKYQIESNGTGTIIEHLDNQIYVLELIDREGKMVSEKVNLEKTKINATVETEELGTKFYDEATSRIDFICNDKNNLYGKIKITNISVDGYIFVIKNVTNVTALPYVNNLYRLNVHAERQNEEVPMLDVNVLITLQANVESGLTTMDCLCDQNNRPSSIAASTGGLSWDLASIAHYWVSVVENLDEYGNGTGTYAIVFNVYQPTSFVLTISQYCGCFEDACILVDNTTSISVQINNGENFNTYLNTMPVKFMLGTTNDNQQATVANQSYFYSSSETDSHIKGWYGLHQEDTYRFVPTTPDNERTWEDFVDLDLGIDSLDTRQRILQYKFNTMFSLSDAAYVTENSDLTFEYTATGGGSRILYRSVVPRYEEMDLMFSQYVLNDYNTATLPDSSFPHIVPRIYSGRTGSSMGPLWNEQYENSDKLGNYFAAFTQNGRYVSTSAINCDINTMRLPNYTTQFPYGDNVSVKKLGQDITGPITNFIRAYNSKDNQTADCQRMSKTQPYLRSLFVDRRFDFDLTVLGPCFGDSFSLHENPAVDRVWKSTRIYGFTYNGIEMSYDKDYNIVSANTSDNGFTKNNRLEYSYSSSDSPYEDAKTYYNAALTDSVWETDEGDSQIIKRPYESTFGTLDIRNLYWSAFNRTRLGYYCNNEQGGPAGMYEPSLPFYVYCYPYSSQNQLGYNWEFNRERVAVDKNYPTIRYLDVGNIYPAERYDFSYISCGYGTNVDINPDNSLEIKASNGESFDFSFDFSSPIQFIPPTEGNDDYGNVVFKKLSVEDDNYVKFVADSVSLNFKFTPRESDDFDIYTRVPIMIKVLTRDTNTGDLGYICRANGHYVDGITYYKTASLNNPTTQDACIRGVDIYNILTDRAIKLHKFNHPNQTFWFINKDTTLPNGVKISDGFTLKNGAPTKGQFYYKTVEGDKEWLKSDDTDFANILFGYTIDVNEDNGASVFAIVIDREYLYKSEDMLNRRFRTVECSDLFDARHVLLKPTPNNPGIPVEINDEGVATSYDTPASYVMVSSAATEAANASANTKIHIQVLAFRMKFSTTGLPTAWQCQAFANYEMMSYIFKFTDNANNIYYVNCNEFYFSKKSRDDVYFLDFVVKWTQNMGIMIDNNWSSGALVEIYAKTPSNFTYKLSEFTIALDNQCYQVNDRGECIIEAEHSKDKMTIGKKLKTDFSIKNG